MTGAITSVFMEDHRWEDCLVMDAACVPAIASALITMHLQPQVPLTSKPCMIQVPGSDQCWTISYHAPSQGQSAMVVLTEASDEVSDWRCDQPKLLQFAQLLLGLVSGQAEAMGFAWAEQSLGELIPLRWQEIGFDPETGQMPEQGQSSG